MAESRNLTTSKVDRQNILNNSLAVTEIEKHTTIDGVYYDGKMYVTKELVAAFFDVEIRTIERYISTNLEELTENGYAVLRGAKLKAFIAAYNEHFATDINVGHKIRALSVFDFRSFLNIAMLLSESENARILRQTMLDIVIDLVNQKTGGSTKFINQNTGDNKIPPKSLPEAWFIPPCCAASCVVLSATSDPLIPPCPSYGFISFSFSFAKL